MKILVTLRCVTLVFMGIVGTLSAQTPRPSPQPMPTGPLIQSRAPEFSRWTVTYNQKRATATKPATAAPEQAKPQPAKRLLVVRTQNVRYSQLSDAAGRQTETWYCDNIEFITDPATKRRLAYAIGHDPELEPETNFSRTDFPGLEWVSAKTYLDVRTVMGRDCIIFSKGGNEPETNQDGPLPASSGGTVAYVDLATRLPILLQSNGENRVYQFEQPPQSKLTLPPDIQQALEFNVKHAQELARMPGRPF